MTKRRVLVGIGLALAAIVVVALAIPDSRYRLLALAHKQKLLDGRPIHYWLLELKSDDAEARRKAAILLGEIDECQKSSSDEKCATIMAALVATLADADALVRKCAATSVLLFPRETPVPTDAANIALLQAALSDKEIAVRRAAVRSLWQAGAVAKTGDGVMRITAALTDPDDFVRMYAARVIGKIGPDAGAAVPTLIERLKKDENTDMRKLSAKALGLIGPEPIGKLLPEAVAGLKDGLNSKSAEFREYAARSLGQLGARDAADPLRRLTVDPDQGVRDAANEALKRLE